MAEHALGDGEAHCAAERQRLVRLCARLTGDAQAAEDLAQEALLRAYRARGSLREPERRQAWLDAIARHVCLDWLRRRARRPEAAVGVPLAEPRDDLDLDRELERGEMVALLDRTLARLPAATRAVLVEHYVRDVPQQEIALRHGWSAGAVAMRLQRGREAMRDLLLTEFREDASELGLVGPASGPGWRPTRLWCGSCGARRLRARFHPGWGVHLECPDCTQGEAVVLHIEGETPFGGMTAAQLLAGVHGVRRARERVAAAFHGLLGKGLPGVAVRCSLCGSPAPLRVGGPYGDIMAVCRACGGRPGLSGIHGVAESHPALIRFQRAHPRIRTRRVRFLEAAGTGAVLLGFDSVTSADRLDFLYAHAPMVLLRVWGGSPTPPAVDPLPNLAAGSPPPTKQA